MYSKIVVLAIIGIGCWLFYNSEPHLLEEEKPKMEHATAAIRPSLCIYFAQDATGSDTVNGVEIVHSDIFNPIFNCVDRNIELYYGIIRGNSAVKPICLKLAAFAFERPLLPATNQRTITERNVESEEYAETLKGYQSDSGEYYSRRKENIRVFISQIEERLRYTASTYASSTDIYSVLVIAKKIFNASLAGTKNILILNSDGKDTQYKHIPDLHLPADVYLTNAGNGTVTSLDSMITNTFSSPEKAIEISLQ